MQVILNSPSIISDAETHLAGIGSILLVIFGFICLIGGIMSMAHALIQRTSSAGSAGIILVLGIILCTTGLGWRNTLNQKQKIASLKTEITTVVTTEQTAMISNELTEPIQTTIWDEAINNGYVVFLNDTEIQDIDSIDPAQYQKIQYNDITKTIRIYTDNTE